MSSKIEVSRELLERITAPLNNCADSAAMLILLDDLRALLAAPNHIGDAAVIDRLNTVVEQQKNLIASLRSELRESYSIDAAVQEEHLDLEAAAKKLAACMDYPWEHMPEQGRASMREHAKAVIDAAKSGASA